MHWIRPEKRARSLTIGAVMVFVLVVGLSWIPFSDFSLDELALALFFFSGPGFLAGREVNFRAFRERFLGVPRGRRDSWWWTAVVASTLNAALVCLGQIVSGEFGFAALGFILWSLGVLLGTGLAVLAEARLERILLQAEWHEDDPHWSRIRRMAEAGVRWEGRLLSRLHG